MGTVSRIVESLLKLSDDKKVLLTKRYDDHKSWMTNELSLIREMIKKSHGTVGNASMEDDKMSTNVGSGRTSEESADSSSSGGSSLGNKKRKTPEISVTSTRHSPDLKRTSVDYEELALAVGLPSDLNKLKKEQLLEELESRGINTFHAKSLKKDLVDALKEAIVSLHTAGDCDFPRLKLNPLFYTNP